MPRLFLLSSFVAFGLSSYVTAGAGAEQADRANLITFELEDGRVLAAQVHPRTDDKTLWLQYGTSDTTLLRPIRWRNVTRCERNGHLLEKSQIIEQAKNQPREGAASSTSPRGSGRANSRFGEVSDAKRAHYLLGFDSPGRH